MKGTSSCSGEKCRKPSKTSEPAYTPTYSSWLNAIEAHFTSLKKFAIGGTDDPSHESRRWRIARYLAWRNKEKGSSKAALAQFSRVKLYRH